MTDVAYPQYEISIQDASTVRVIVDKAIGRGPESAARALAVHEAALASAMERLAVLDRKVAAERRTIGMRLRATQRLRAALGAVGQ